MKVLISDAVAPACVDILSSEGIEADVQTGLSTEQLRHLIGQYDGLIVRSATKVTREVIEAASRLKVIGRAGAGVDNIDVSAATHRGIVVMNTPGGNTVSTAELSFSMILALSRNIPQATTALKAGTWNRKKYTGVEVQGKTLGIIGVGKVGREVAVRARAFGMNVLGYDPFIVEEVASKLGVELVSLENLYARSDYITIHTPLNDQTRNLLSEDELARCKTGVRIINCARGGIVDEAALLRAIESGKVAGAALDVFAQEPPTCWDLIRREEVICTPHLGASTAEAQTTVALQIARQIATFLKNGTVQNAVNLTPMDAAIYDKIRTYVELAEKIGSLQVQLSKGRLKNIAVEYRGEILDYPTSPVTAAVLKGALAGSSDIPLNLVNAPVIAQERGIQIEEIRHSEHENYLNLITVTYRTDREERIVSGTIFGKNDPRIVRINEYHFDARPEGNMLFCGNEDVPGVIGRIGTLLGDNGINIARMSWGREQPGGKAVTVLNLDNPVPDHVLTQITAQPNILWARRAKL